MASVHRLLLKFQDPSSGRQEAGRVERAKRYMRDVISMLAEAICSDNPRVRETASGVLRLLPRTLLELVLLPVPTGSRPRAAG